MNWAGFLQANQSIIEQRTWNLKKFESSWKLILIWSGTDDTKVTKFKFPPKEIGVIVKNIFYLKKQNL